MKPVRETELFQPVNAFLTQLGYIVKAEINNVDVVGIKEDVTLAVELKKTLSLTLIYQAIERQRYMDIVYIAIPKHAMKKRQTFKRLTHLLRRLELGLLLIEGDNVHEVITPKPYSVAKSKARSNPKKQRTLETFHALQSTSNVGGTNGRVMTLYKEQVHTIQELLRSRGPLTVKEITSITGISKAASILQKNYSGVFLRVSRGIYNVTEK